MTNFAKEGWTLKRELPITVQRNRKEDVLTQCVQITALHQGFNSALGPTSMSIHGKNPWTKFPWSIHGKNPCKTMNRGLICTHVSLGIEHSRHLRVVISGVLLVPSTILAALVCELLSSIAASVFWPHTQKIGVPTQSRKKYQWQKRKKITAPK